MPGFHWAVFEAGLNPATGTEQKGMRPVLIVSNEEFNQAMPNVTILPLTSTQRRLYPSEVRLPEGKGGQPLESIVMAHQIRTMSKQRLKRLLGYVDDTQLQQEIHRAIKEHLDME
ncbi:MAG: type II toxin-antitoxin system PemK/MazF family toxin [Dehalococcoidia bacterium]